MKWIRLRIYKSPQRPRLLDFAGSKETEAGRVGDMAARGKPRGPEESRGEPSLCVLRETGHGEPGVSPNTNRMLSAVCCL